MKFSIVLFVIFLSALSLPKTKHIDAGIFTKSCIPVQTISGLVHDKDEIKIVDACYPLEDSEYKNIEFSIIGNAINGEGHVLALNIPSLGVDNRLRSTIENGKFEFCGKLPFPERASISFDFELEEYDGMYSVYDVFLTKNTLQIDVVVDELHGNLYFAESSFEDNGVNSYYHKYIDSYNKSQSGIWVKLSDSTHMDSLEQYIFPHVRREQIQLNSELFNGDNGIIGLANLRYMLSDNIIFAYHKITDSQKLALTTYFNDIDISLSKSPDYKVVSTHINRLNQDSTLNSFKDFTLKDINGQNTTLSDIIAKNQYTILDFWWSGCAPCRKFNKENQEHYQSLKKKHIEVIGINVDDSFNAWKKSSLQDGIKWKNLYAGANSKIEVEYDVNAFPTKIVVNNNREIIDLSFKDLDQFQKFINL